MIRHIVLLALPSDHDAAALEDAMTLLANLQSKVPGMSQFHHGPNLDYEDKSAAYTYGFSMDFENREVHLTYETHPDHQRAGGILVSLCTGGHDGIFVADLQSG